MNIIKEEVNKNEVVQNLLFTDFNDINFEFGDKSKVKSNTADVIINGKKVPKNIVTINVDRVWFYDYFYVPFIVVGEEYRRYGIGTKILAAFINKFEQVYIKRTSDDLANKFIGSFVKKIKNNVFPFYVRPARSKNKVTGFTVGKQMDQKELHESNKINKRVYLTEEQYSYILGHELLNEAMLSKLFAGCNTTEDKVKRVKELAKKGFITLGVLYAIIATIALPQIQQDKLKQEVQEIVASNDNNNNNNNNSQQKSTTSLQAQNDNINNNVVYATNIKMSNNGIQHLKQYEKLSLKPYYATKKEKELGIRTIGYGHTIKKDDPSWLVNAKEITEQQAEQLLINDVSLSEHYIRQLIMPTLNNGLQNPNALPQKLVDVIISMVFNAGIGNFRDESINPFYTRLKACRLDKDSGKINMQDYNYTVAAIKYSLTKQKGKELDGLKARRAVECNMAMLK